jgi:tellurite methyltransferase
MSIKSQLQNTDIYIIDQILKGRFDHCTSVLDVGCGKGRNLVYFLQNNFNVYGVDANQDNVSISQKLAINLNPNSLKNNFKTGLVEEIPFDFSFDLIICNAVLHFAKSKTHFEQMLSEMWRKLNKDGILFIRLASNIGIEKIVTPIENGVYKLPDCSSRYLVSQKMLLNYTLELEAELIEPIKTTNVQNLRCMTTWIIRKE